MPNENVELDVPTDITAINNYHKKLIRDANRGISVWGTATSLCVVGTVLLLMEGPAIMAFMVLGIALVAALILLDAIGQRRFVGELGPSRLVPNISRLAVESAQEIKSSKSQHE